MQGKETLTPQALSKPGGILFLANHPAEIDPLILITTFWFPFKPHPVAIDYLFRKPLIRSLLGIVGALSIPNFDASSNSYKRREMQKTYARIFSSLDHKENFLIYPAGSLKNGPEEVIGGASGIHTILQTKPETNVVLIRTTGLWGSTFSRAPTGKTPDLGKTFFSSFKVLLRNFIFFTPRRDVLVECTPASADFPWKGDRRDLNRYLERWYNAQGPEPLNLVSFSHFRKDCPIIKEKITREEIDLDRVLPEIKQGVIEEIVKVARVPRSEITLTSHLAQDLGFDSLDLAQLIVALKEKFGINSLNASDLSTVGSVIAYASKMQVGSAEEEEKGKVGSTWGEEKQRPRSLYPEGETILELFFDTCERMGRYSACADQIAGELSYKRLKIGVILLAEVIRKIPDERIGIMMPASVAVNAMILATMLAGKIPVMINWTLGERNLISIVEQAKINITLSSWNFLDRLDNVELDGLDDRIILLEDLRHSFSIFDKMKAYRRSRRKTKVLLKLFGVDQILRKDVDHLFGWACAPGRSRGSSFRRSLRLLHQGSFRRERLLFSQQFRRGPQLTKISKWLAALPSYPHRPMSLGRTTQPSSRSTRKQRQSTPGPLE